MDDKYTHARERFHDAIRAMVTSPASIQARLVDAYTQIRSVTLDELDGDIELKLKLARILDLLSADTQDIDREVIVTTAYLTDLEAIKIATLICDFHYDLG